MLMSFKNEPAKSTFYNLERLRQQHTPQTEPCDSLTTNKLLQALDDSNEGEDSQ